MSAPPGAPDAPWVVIPAKSFARAKSRLAPTLEPAARTAIALDMLRAVLSAAEGARLGPVLVLTDGDDVAAVVAARGAAVVRDAAPGTGTAGEATLAAVVDRGLGAAHARGARRALVVMGDLPRLTAADLGAVAAALDHHDVVLAPDAQGTGTSALGCWLPAGPTRFGSAESLARHREDAARRGARVALIERPGLALDVDTAADLWRLSPEGVAGA